MFATSLCPNANAVTSFSLNEQFGGQSQIELRAPAQAEIGVAEVSIVAGDLREAAFEVVA